MAKFIQQANTITYVQRLKFSWRYPIIPPIVAGFFFVLILTGCAHTDEWTKRDTLLQLGATAMMVADAVTTNRIQNDQNTYENGPVAKHFLGPQPSTSDTYQYFGTVIISSYFISRALPAKWRPYYQVWEIGAHGYGFLNNCNNDLC